MKLNKKRNRMGSRTQAESRFLIRPSIAARMNAAVMSANGALDDLSVAVVSGQLTEAQAARFSRVSGIAVAEILDRNVRWK